MPDRQFVIQEHTTAEGIHWDFMLEEDDALTTFRLEEMPTTNPGATVRAEKIFDHPLRFLTYEGPVQQGTGRVRIVDRGTYRLLASTDRTIVMALDGATLQGHFSLTQMDQTQWDFASDAASE